MICVVSTWRICFHIFMFHSSSDSMPVSNHGILNSITVQSMRFGMGRVEVDRFFCGCFVFLPAVTHLLTLTHTHPAVCSSARIYWGLYRLSGINILNLDACIYPNFNTMWTRKHELVVIVVHINNTLNLPVGGITGQSYEITLTLWTTT